MLVELLIGLLAILIVAWYVMKKRGQAGTERPEPIRSPGSKTSKFHAVSILFEPDACAAAREMAGRRFLSSAAPKLPLPGCDAPSCKCHFKHHADRRSGKDRRNPFSPAGLSAATGNYRQERRSGKDRRRDDDDDLEKYL